MTTTTTDPYDIDTVKLAFEVVLKQNPHRSNDGRCYYRRNRQPHCVIANVLDVLGIDLSFLDDDDGFDGSWNSSRVGTMLRACNLNDRFTSGAIILMASVQKIADDVEGDGSISWAVAYEQGMLKLLEEGS